jgi:hypothetical protein
MSIRLLSWRFSPAWKRNGRSRAHPKRPSLGDTCVFQFAASRNPEQLELAQRVPGIPFKRAQQRVIDYLKYEEIDSILKAID